MSKLNDIKKLVEPISKEEVQDGLPHTATDAEQEAFIQGREAGRAELAQEVIEIVNGENN